MFKVKPLIPDRKKGKSNSKSQSSFLTNNFNFTDNSSKDGVKISNFMDYESNILQKVEIKLEKSPKKLEYFNSDDHFNQFISPREAYLKSKEIIEANM